MVTRLQTNLLLIDPQCVKHFSVSSSWLAGCTASNRMQRMATKGKVPARVYLMCQSFSLHFTQQPVGTPFLDIQTCCCLFSLLSSFLTHCLLPLLFSFSYPNSYSCSSFCCCLNSCFTCCCCFTFFIINAAPVVFVFHHSLVINNNNKRLSVVWKVHPHKANLNLSGINYNFATHSWVYSTTIIIILETWQWILNDEQRSIVKNIKTWAIIRITSLLRRKWSWCLH